MRYVNLAGRMPRCPVVLSDREPTRSHLLPKHVRHACCNSNSLHLQQIANGRCVMSTATIEKQVKPDDVALGPQELKRRSTRIARTHRPRGETSGKVRTPTSPPEQEIRVTRKRRLTPEEVERIKRRRRARLKRSQQATRNAPQIRHHEPLPRAVDGWHFSLEHVFVYFSYVVAALLATVFGLDLLTGIPFIRASVLFDVTNVICGLTLGYLSWNTHRDLR